MWVIWKLWNLSYGTNYSTEVGRESTFGEKIAQLVCFFFLPPPKSVSTCSLEESYDQSRQHIKKQRHYFADKGPSRQSYGFSSGYVWMRELDYEESWVLKNWCFWTVVLEKTLESLLDSKEIQPVHSEGDQSWTFIGSTVEAETLILWSPDVKNWLIWKDPDAGKDWRWEEKGTTEDEMVGWHHQLHGHEFEKPLAVTDG